MTSVSRASFSLCGLACLALAGCCTAQKAGANCSNCSQSVVAEVPSTYENYTPPQPKLSPIPMPTPGPAADTVDPPPPPATRNDTNKVIDYFESSTEPRRNL